MTNTTPDTPKTSKSPTSMWWILILVLIACLAWQFWPRQVVNDNPTTQATTNLPVIYDVDNWAISPKKELDDALTQLGNTGTHETGLDIEGQPAKITRFSTLSEPPLTVSISDKFVEVSWYFAPKTDSEPNKTISQNHAKKAHAFATALLGSSAHDTLKSMLTTPDQDFAKSGIHLAMCKHYQCQLIIPKSQINK